MNCVTASQIIMFSSTCKKPKKCYYHFDQQCISILLPRHLGRCSQWLDPGRQTCNLTCVVFDILKSVSLISGARPTQDNATEFKIQLKISLLWFKENWSNTKFLCQWIDVRGDINIDRNVFSGTVLYVRLHARECHRARYLRAQSYSRDKTDWTVQSRKLSYRGENSADICLLFPLYVDINRSSHILRLMIKFEKSLW